MKKEFEDPKVGVVYFTVEDILTASGSFDDGTGDGTGGGIGGDNETPGGRV